MGLVAALALAGPTSTQTSAAKVSVATGQRQLREAAQNFVANVGQWDSRAKFLARTRNMNVWVTDKGLSFDYHKTTVVDGRSSQKGHVVSMELVGASSPAKVVGVSPSAFRFGYAKSAGSATKFSSTFAEVRAEDAVKGVDLRAYKQANKPRYDLIVEPGTSVDSVKLRFKGADVKVSEKALSFATQIGAVKHDGLFAYQVINGSRKSVPVSFKALGANQVGFKVGAYDASKPLVIDPLVYGSYYGGDNGFDEVRSVAGDSDGGVYMVGSTSATQFPIIQGPYFLNLSGTSDAFVAKLQGDAYRHDYCVFLGGTQADVAKHVKIDPFGNIWVAGTTFSTDFPGNTRRSINFLSQTSGLPASGGTFRLQHGTTLTAQIPWNATPAQVKDACDLAFGGSAIVTSMNGQNLPSGRYKISLDNNLPLRLTVVSARTTDPDTFEETNEGLPSVIASYPPGPATINLYTVQEFRRRGSVPLFQPDAPTDARWQIRFTRAGVTEFSEILRHDATPAQVQAAIEAMPNVGAGNVTVTGGGPLYQHVHTVVFGGALAAAQTKLIVANAPQPSPVYSIYRPSDIFVIRFARSGAILDPLPSTTEIIGGEDEEENLSGFAVVPAANPAPSDPIRFMVLGDTSGTNAIPGITGSPNENGTTGFIKRYSYDGASFNVNSAASMYIQTGGTGASIFTTGLSTDSSGAAYLAGTVQFNGTVDNRTSSVFAVTDGIFNEGWLLRNTDIFVRKYGENGSLIYSGLIGGNNTDSAAGRYTDITGSVVNLGSSIDVDPLGNAYVLGTSTSFNFPRTRGVFGETFDNNPVVTVTKISASGGSIVYSTNLKTSGSVFPGGIAVDANGSAFITGMLTRNPLRFPQPPGNPNEPNGSSASSVQLTGDALDPTYDSPATPELPTTEGWFNVLNPTASTLLYGSYIGGFLDEMVFGPSLDAFGDVWVAGWTDSYRQYFRGLTVYTTTGALPANLITPLAFKAQGDATGNTGLTVLYGLLESPFTGPATIGSTYRRDGFLFKQRINLPIVTSLALDPTTIPGGLGATSTGTVTLSQAAPVGGAEIVVTLANTDVASLSTTTDLATAKFTIPEGATTGTFTVYSKAVLEPGSVDVKAEYLNTFKIQRLTVIPWLEGVAVVPDSIVGGNDVLGRVTLARPAPAGGVTVDLLTDRPDLITYPDNNASNTVVVPAGQTSATFTVRTGGVPTTTPVEVNALLLGVTKSAKLNLTVASLDRIELTPSIVAGGSTVSGTVYLNGQAGSTFTVDLSIVGGLPSGYAFVPGTTLTFAAGETSKDFTITTPYAAVDVNRIVRATRTAQGDYPLSVVESSFRVLAIQLLTFKIEPAKIVDDQPTLDGEVDGGATATGTVTISSPAPAGGVVLSVAATVNGTKVTIPSTILVPEGASSVDFDIEAGVVIPTTDVTIEVSRGPATISRVLTIRGITATVGVSPNSVVGGAENAVGTVVLSRNAPAGGVTVDLTSSDPSAASVPESVTIPEGESTANFTITTSDVVSTTSVTIGSSIEGTDQGSATLQVRRRGIARILFNPSQVRALRTTICTVTLDAPAKSGGATVNLTATNVSLLNLPSSVVVPAGATSVSFPVIARRVSRSLSTTVTATLVGTGATSSTVVTVLR